MITLASAKAAILKAHAEGRLAAQQPKPLLRYNSPHSRPGRQIGCAIGVCLSPEAANRVQNTLINNDYSYAVDALIDGNIIAAEPGITAELRKVQTLHDVWASNVVIGDTVGARTGEGKFLDYVNQL